MRYKIVDVRMWGDEKFRSLSIPKPNAQTLFLYLLTGPYMSSLPGLYRVGKSTLMEDLGWDSKGFREGFAKAFREVSEKGLVRADFDSKVLFVPNAIKYNKPQSPNVIRSWARGFDEVPECGLKSFAFHRVEKEIERMSKGFREAFRHTFGKAKPYQEQEQEQEQEQYLLHPPIRESGGKSLSQFSVLSTEILGYLNDRAGRRLRGDGQTKFIEARLREGATVEQCRAVIDLKTAEWQDNDEMKKYLSCDTLFNKTKFQKYVVETEETGKTTDGLDARYHRVLEKMETGKQAENGGIQ